LEILVHLNDKFNFFFNVKLKKKKKRKKKLENPKFSESKEFLNLS